MADNPSTRRTTKVAIVDTVAMRHENGAGCSWRGQSFASDAKGIVRVPVLAAAELRAHGFIFVAA